MTEMLKIRDSEQLENLISDISAIAFSLRPLIIRSLLGFFDKSLRAKLERNASDTGSDFLYIFLEIYQDDNCKEAADRMLDHYLMPEITLFGDPSIRNNFIPWETRIVNNFNELLEVPELKRIAIEKYHSYNVQKKWLPHIVVVLQNNDENDETANIIKNPINNNLHKFYRASVLKKIKQLITAWENS